MRFLGIDYGTKRVGLAVGDNDTGFAFPLMTVNGDPESDAVDAIVTLVAEENIQHIVIGMPYRMSGESDVKGETLMRIEAFIVALGERMHIPISTEDERMTTAYVERMRKDSGMKKEHFDKDSAAAAAILDTYLSRIRNAST